MPARISYVKFSTLEFNSFNLDVFDLWSRGGRGQGRVIILLCYFKKKETSSKVMQAAILCVALVFFSY